ncbi:unnamed protein product, partial [Mesorhabditis spiculigera]
MQDGFSKEITDYINNLIEKSSLEEWLDGLKAKGVPGIDTTLDFVTHLRQLSALQQYLAKELTPSEQDELANIRAPISKLARVVQDQVGASRFLSTETQKVLDKVIWGLNSVNLFSNIAKSNADPLGKLYNTLEKAYQQQVRINGTDSARGNAVAGIIEALVTMIPDTVDLILSPIIMDSNYKMATNTYRFFPVAILDTLRSDIAVKQGLTYHVAAHEIYHAVFFAERDLPHDKEMLRRQRCYIQHVERVEKAFIKEEEAVAHSGDLTYGEDAPDFEGLQASYMMLKEYGKLEEKPYHDLNMTRQQLFFYTYAATQCRDDQFRRTPPNQADPHSLGYVRINAPTSLLTSFHEAFKCPASSRMRQLYLAANHDECNLIGQVARLRRPK